MKSIFPNRLSIWVFWETGDSGAMNDQWDADLRTLELVQADLRRRLESLDRQIAHLRTEMAQVAPGGKAPDVPAAPSAPSVDKPSALPPPLPG